MTNNGEMCLFLTGTIKPKNVPNLELVDFAEREDQYNQAISRWCKLGYSLVFCENSNFKSSKIEETLKSSNIRHEYIKFETKVSEYGKGHGEAEIFKYAFEHSDILRASETICKVTGRHFVKNAETLINNATINSNVWVNSNLTGNLTSADSRFFLFKNEFFYRYLLKACDKIDESSGLHFEHALAESIHRCIADNNKWMLLNELPIYDGISGTKNIKFKTGLITKIKYKIYGELKKYVFTKDI